jgi:hypothetical protein
VFPLAHIAGLPVEELALPAMSAWSVSWLALRLMLRRESNRADRRRRHEADG